MGLRAERKEGELKTALYSPRWVLDEAEKNLHLGQAWKAFGTLVPVTLNAEQDQVIDAPQGQGSPEWPM